MLERREVRGKSMKKEGIAMLGMVPTCGARRYQPRRSGCAGRGQAEEELFRGREGGSLSLTTVLGKSCDGLVISDWHTCGRGRSRKGERRGGKDRRKHREPRHSRGPITPVRTAGRRAGARVIEIWEARSSPSPPEVRRRAPQSPAAS